MMKLLDISMIKRVASPRHRKVHLRHDPWEVSALFVRLVAVGLLSWDGWAHLHLWQDGYRHIPTIGPLFLVGAVSAMAVAAGLLLRPSRLLGLAGAGVEIGILAGLIVSVNFGLFGFKESLSAAICRRVDRGGVGGGPHLGGLGNGRPDEGHAPSRGR